MLLDAHCSTPKGQKCDKILKMFLLLPAGRTMRPAMVRMLLDSHRHMKVPNGAVIALIVGMMLAPFIIIILCAIAIQACRGFRGCACRPHCFEFLHRLSSTLTCSACHIAIHQAQSVTTISNS